MVAKNYVINGGLLRVDWGQIMNLRYIYGNQ